jgi:4-hydroxy-4-methyl-2-oxoglutarate aldolase
MAEKMLTGKIDRSQIGMLEVPRIPDAVLQGFRELGDATCAVSDALDDLGIPGAIAGSTLRCTIPGGRLVGSALTMRNELRPGDPMQHARDKTNKLAEIECHNLSQPDDVIVIQGLHDISNMGGVGVRIGKRQGEQGAIIDGSIRDVGDGKEVGYPIWCTGVTPKTGKWRVQPAEINRPVVICGVRVEPGDLVVADETGVCFVPHALAEKVLAFAKKKAKAENDKALLVDQGLSILELEGVIPRRS